VKSFYGKLEGKTIKKFELKLEQGVLEMTMTDGTEVNISSPVGDILVTQIKEVKE